MLVLDSVLATHQQSAFRGLSSRLPLLMPKELFGTDGIRGVPGTPPLDDGTLYATGRSLGNYLKETSPAARVLIGMDTRESGPHIAAVLAAGLGHSGVTVDFAGIITTPGVACLVRQRGFQAGVVISASHNPRPSAIWKAWPREALGCAGNPGIEHPNSHPLLAQAVHSESVPGGV